MHVLATVREWCCDSKTLCDSEKQNQGFCSWKSDVRLFVHLHPVRLLSTDCNALQPPGDIWASFLLHSWLLATTLFFFSTPHLYPDEQIVAMDVHYSDQFLGRRPL